jgi:hypothetical protein
LALMRRLRDEEVETGSGAAPISLSAAAGRIRMTISHVSGMPDDQNAWQRQLISALSCVLAE